tara:strand:- start:3167 stop:3316 length:150 start_codon:yes stop_codon:yes gene_type:complete
MKEMGNIVVDTFKTKQQADKEIEYRNSLCRNMGYEPDIMYKLREVKEKQ